MKTTVTLWVISLFITGCTPAPEKDDPNDRYTGLYVAETVFDSGKQWDTLEVRKAGTANPDSFAIFYTDGYIKKLPNGQWTEHKIGRDTFPALFDHSFECILVGDPLSMAPDSINGQLVRTPPFRPMHIDTVNKKATFGGFAYKKIE